MKMTLKSVATAFLVASAVPVSAADYYLYTPHKTDEAKIPAGESGVLVKEITIKWGDTLYALSRQYSGKGTYYPQILLFNNIKDPDLIYAGKKLRVPVQHAEDGRPDQAGVAPSVRPEKRIRQEKAQEPRAERPAPFEPAPPAEREGRRLPTPVVPQAEQAPAPKPAAPDAPKAAPSDLEEQRLYRQGILLFKQGDFAGALAQFDEFLAKYPSSDLAADVTLYRAESLLKMAGAR